MEAGPTSNAALIDDGTDQSRKAHSELPAWRVAVFGGIGVAAFVLLTNVAVLSWTKASFSLVDGIATAYTGPCQTSKKVTLGVAVVVNILSTLLLAASNNGAQILSSPTRADIAVAHGRKKWLDIGIPSIRNLWHIPIWRSVLWVLLFASSIPLHLMYNSTIFTSRQANNYNAFAVTEDFQNVGIGNANGWISEPVLQTARVMQRNMSALIVMSNAECLRNYTQSAFQTKWHNLLIVTDAKLPSGESIANVYSGNWTTTRGLPEWPCTGSAAILDILDPGKEQHVLGELFGAYPMFGLLNGTLQNAKKNLSDCDWPSLINNGPSWRLALADRYHTTTHSTHAGVQYCLAEAGNELCSILINTNLLLVVIICNAIKILCLGTIACIRNFAPLVTIGDAIESFLTNPEQETARLGPISASDVRKGRLASRRHVDHRRTVRVGRSRANVASRTRWTVCITVYMILLIVPIGLLMLGTGKGLIWNFDTFHPNNVVQLSLGLSVAENVMLANTPQLATSFAYLFFNNIFTCMVLAGEFATFASTRKTLRVSRPQGKQRSTFWLTLPYRYSIPMLSASALLHYLISGSLFFVKLEVKDPNGKIVLPAEDAKSDEYASGVTGCAYSPGAISAALGLWTAFIITLMRYSTKRLHPGIPVAGSCSLALSAASHCSRTDVDAATLPLQYGIYVEDGEDGTWYEKVGFSSESIAPHVKLLPYYQYAPALRPIYNERWAQAVKDFKPTTRSYAQEELPARLDLTRAQRR